MIQHYCYRYNYYKNCFFDIIDCFQSIIYIYMESSEILRGWVQYRSKLILWISIYSTDSHESVNSLKTWSIPNWIVVILWLLRAKLWIWQIDLENYWNCLITSNPCFYLLFIPTSYSVFICEMKRQAYLRDGPVNCWVDSSHHLTLRVFCRAVLSPSWAPH